MGRLGHISNVDYATGKVKATYNGKVTKDIPFIANGEYHMPKKGDLVVILTDDDTGENIACIGTTYNDTNTPEESGDGYFFKRFNDSCSMEATSSDIVFDVAGEKVSMKKVKHLIDIH
ncbi:MAG: hypothetical protein MR324_11125 [Lachnospiraceae bacterium]|nr:hypothetical protein [Lachnospiraceae bacterium]